MEGPVDSYVVRVYRQEKDNPRKLVGVVEEVGVKGKRAFTNIDDLWVILNQDADEEKKRKLKDKKVE
jgi:predicted transcriptional regulator YdeE